MNILRASLAALAVTALGAHAWAQKEGVPVVSTKLHSVTATVKSIDPATRQITLDAPEGMVSFQVDPAVKRLSDVHVGDRVVVSYLEGVAAQVVKGDKKATDPAGSSFTYRTPGKKPGGGVGQSVTATVTIVAINRSAHTVTFKRADGSIDTILVRAPEMVEFLKTLNPGDLVEVTYTESLAINVLPAKGT